MLDFFCVASLEYISPLLGFDNSDFSRNALDKVSNVEL